MSLKECDKIDSKIPDSLRRPYYETVKKAEFAATGYVRGGINIESIQKLVVDFLGPFFVDPDKDPSNFITEDDIKKADKLREEGNQFMKQQNYAQALKKYTESLSYNINDAKTRSNRSLCYLRSEELDKATSDAKYAIYNEPLWHKSWLRMAQIFEAKCEYRESLNMIKHAISVCSENKDKRNKKILKKYLFSVTNKKDEYFEQYPDKMNINHMEDEDRAEWKYCDPGMIDENKMTDEKLLNAAPNKIFVYSQSITPIRMLYQLFDRDGYKDLDAELERWSKRKWIRKVSLFRDLNTCKLLLNYKQCVHNQAPVKYGDIWTITWSALSTLYLNKRCVVVQVHCSDFDKDTMVAAENTYGKPTAKFLIECVIKAILSPLDADPRRPMRLDIQWRMKDEFDEIEKAMNELGIYCRLRSFERDMEECKEHETNVYGWNYLELPAFYKYDEEC